MSERVDEARDKLWLYSSSDSLEFGHGFKRYRLLESIEFSGELIGKTFNVFDTEKAQRKFAKHSKSHIFARNSNITLLTDPKHSIGGRL
jgi:hypothetical protein